MTQQRNRKPITITTPPRFGKIAKEMAEARSTTTSRLIEAAIRGIIHIPPEEYTQWDIYFTNMEEKENEKSNA